MTYLVNEVKSLHQPPPAAILRSLHYPPKEIRGMVTSEIALWEVERNVGGFFTLSYWKSVFNLRKDYNIILRQKDPVTSNVRNFLLHSTDNLALAQSAYNLVCNSLEPFIDDCTLLMTKELLEEIILPTPKMVTEVVHHLAEVMESNPRAHSDWFKVLQSLVLKAIKNDDEQVAESVLKSSVDVRAANLQGNTLLHLARSVKGIQLVVKKATEDLSNEEKSKLLNQPNQEGKAPLHSAFKKNIPEVVCELLRAGADLDILTEDEDGSNPFHVAAESGSAESVGAAHHNKDDFLHRESDLENPEKQRLLQALNTVNKKGLTPLMISVQKNYINSTVTFLQAGADPNVQHRDSGDAALHYAAEKGNATLLKALIVFGADLKLQNNAGKVPLDIAQASETKGARECVDILKETRKAIEEGLSQISDEFEPLPVPSNSIFLLSMDGGGMRGMLLTQTLIAIQKRMKTLKFDCQPVRKCFDYIAGTSAGGMVTLAIVNGARPEATLAAQFKISEVISRLSPTFPDEAISKMIKEIYGNDTMMTDVQMPRVIIPTVLADRNPPMLHLICNYGKPRNSQKSPHEWKVWEASMATSAAPVYFSPFERIFVDGGVMANNPTLDAMAEIFMQTEEEGSNAKLALVVSIGTGVLPTSDVTDLNIFVPNLTNVFKAIVNLPSTLSSLGSILQLLISQATASQGQETTRAEAFCRNMGIAYYRLCAPLTKVVDLSESDKTVLTDMLYQGHLYLLRNVKQIDMIARYLLSRSEH